MTLIFYVCFSIFACFEAGIISILVYYVDDKQSRQMLRKGWRVLEITRNVFYFWMGMREYGVESDQIINF